MNLNQITVKVRDVEKSVKFYQDLGLKLIVNSTAHYARFESANGDATFSIHHSETLNNEDGAWIYFETDDVDKQVTKLLKKGFEFEEMPNDKPWLWREARLKDPDNNQIIIYFAGDNRKNPPWRINE